MGGYRNNTLLKWLEPTTNKNFKKLYRILDTDHHPWGLEIGNYTLHTDNSCNFFKINFSTEFCFRLAYKLSISRIPDEKVFLDPPPFLGWDRTKVLGSNVFDSWTWSHPLIKYISWLPNIYDEQKEKL